MTQRKGGRTAPSDGREIVEALSKGKLSASEAADLINQLPAKDTKKLAIELTQLSAYSGPIPPPEMLQHYDEIIPGLAETIIANWNAESDHRRAMEQAGLLGEQKAERRGQWLGAAVAVAIPLAAITAGVLGLDEIGIALATIGVAGIVTVLIRGSGR